MHAPGPRVSFVPGAPGGLGIREAALVALLGATVGESTVLLAAVMFRMITTLGDSLFFFLSAVWASDVENGEARRIENDFSPP